MKKRFLAMFLALAMCLALLPAAALAAETQTYYILDKNGKEILRCTNYQVILQDGPDMLMSFEQNGKWGYIDQNGTVVIPARLDYDFAEAFSDGLARVTKNDKYGYIDRTGKEVIALKYDDADSFENGRAVVKLGEWKGEGEDSWFDGKAGLIDKTGKVVIPFQYDEIQTYFECTDRFGLVLNDENGNPQTIGLADADGNVLLKPGTYQWFSNFGRNGLFNANVQTETGYLRGVVSKDGKVVVPAIYDGIGLVHNGNNSAIIVEKKDGNRIYHGLFSASGEQLLPVKYDIRHLNGTSLLEVIDGQYPDETIAIVDFSGRMVADFGKYSYMIDFAAGIGELIPVAKNGAQGRRDRKWGALDRAGKEVIPCTLDIDVAYDGGDGTLSVVKDQTHRGLVDQTGTMIVPMEYGSATAYKNVIIIYRDEKYGLLDRSGKKTILPMEYDGLYVHGDVILAAKNNKWGAFDTAGKAIVPITYDEAYMISDEQGLIGVRTGEWGDAALYGAYNAQGMEILPVEYKYLQLQNESWFVAVKPDTPTTPDQPVTQFSDVKTGDWFYDAVNWAVEKGITKGTSDTTFDPDADCTHDHILTFLWRAAGEPESAAALPFTPKNDWAAGALAWAYEKGMIGADLDEDAACASASAVVYIWQAKGEPPAAYDGRFTDVSTDAHYAPAVAWAVDSGVTNGTSATTFGPATVCSRARIVTFLQRAFQ